MRGLKSGFLIFLAACAVAGCVTLGSARFSLTQEYFLENYPQIKSIIVEEAANNGFGALTSEVKPSEFNDWTGKLFFQLKTANGTDQLFVEFSKDPNGVNIWVHGAGTRSNPDSAAKAIQARLSRIPKVNAQRAANAAPTSTQTQSSEPKPATVAQPNEAKPSAPLRASVISTTEIQRKLNVLGYNVGVPDGVSGRRTVDALKKFQQNNQLAVSGVADEETWSKLNQQTTGRTLKAAAPSASKEPVSQSSDKSKQNEL